MLEYLFSKQSFFLDYLILVLVFVFIYPQGFLTFWNKPFLSGVEIN